MGGVIPDDALELFLQLKRLFMESLTMHLFQNEVAVDGETVLADFEEADFQGYDSQIIGDFFSPYLLEPGLAVMKSPTKEFTSTGGAVPNDVYGFYLTSPAGAYVYGEEFESGPVTVDAAAITIAVQFDFYEARYTPE